MAKSQDITETQTSGSSNPMVTQTLNQLLGGPGGLQQLFAQGPRPTGPGATTQAGWNTTLNAARNPSFMQGNQAAMNYSNRLLSNGGLTGGGGWNAQQQSNPGMAQAGGGPGGWQGGPIPQGASPMGGGISPNDAGGGGPPTSLPGRPGGGLPTDAGGGVLNPSMQGWQPPRGQGGNDIMPWTPPRGAGGNDIMPSGGPPTSQPGGPMGGAHNDVGGGQWGDLQDTRNIGGAYGQLGANQGLNPLQHGLMGQMPGIQAGYGQIGHAANGPGIYEQTMGNVARGGQLNGNNPEFQRDLTRTLDTAGAGVNSALGAGGRYGSGAHVGALGRTLGGISDSALMGERRYADDRQQQALGGIGGERQQNINNRFGALQGQQGVVNDRFGMSQQGVNNQFNALGGRNNQAQQAFGMEQQGINNAMGAGQGLASLFGGSFMPGQAIGGVGAEQDAWAQQQNNGQMNHLASLASIFGGTAPFGGTTQTNTQPGTPWWQQLMGYVANNAGQAMQYGGGM